MSNRDDGDVLPKLVPQRALNDSVRVVVNSGSGLVSLLSEGLVSDAA